MRALVAEIMHKIYFGNKIMFVHKIYFGHKNVHATTVLPTIRKL